MAYLVIIGTAEQPLASQCFEETFDAAKKHVIDIHEFDRNFVAETDDAKALDDDIIAAVISARKAPWSYTDARGTTITIKEWQSTREA